MSHAGRSIPGALDRVLDWAVVGLMATLVLDILWQVFARYVLAAPSSWTEELATFLLIWLALLGAAVGLRERAHLGIDYLTAKLPPERRRAVEALAFALTAAFCAIVLTYGGSTLVLRTLALDQHSPRARCAHGLRLSRASLGRAVRDLVQRAVPGRATRRPRRGA